MLRCGLVINPLAGLGGPTALKGSDGLAEAALARGGVARAEARARTVLEALAPRAASLELIVWGGAMGEDAAAGLGFPVTVLGAPEHEATTSEDTVRAVRALVDAECDLLLFAGGDGTARDVVRGVGASRQPVLGIPAGVKMHSGVFAVTPEAAVRVVEALLDGALCAFGPADVRDLDEDDYRAGRVRARVFGELDVPGEPRWVQHTKIGGRENEDLAVEEIAAWMVERLRGDDAATWIVGPGSTTAAILDALGAPGTLLGVDLVRAGEVVARDLTSTELEAIVADLAPADLHLLVTAIGGQGHVLGRGNQQLSPAVLRRVPRDHVHVVATRTKLAGLEGRPLLVDSGDAALDASFAGHLPVITGYEDEVLYPVGLAP